MRQPSSPLVGALLALWRIGHPSDWDPLTEPLPKDARRARLELFAIAIGIGSFLALTGGLIAAGEGATVLPPLVVLVYTAVSMGFILGRRGRWKPLNHRHTQTREHQDTPHDVDT